VVYGLYELSSVNLRLPPSPSRSFSAIREDLAPALARQDHTTSPSVSMLHVSSIFASTAFRSTFVTIAIRPCVGAERGELNHNFRKNERQIFFVPGLDKPKQLKSEKANLFARRAAVRFDLPLQSAARRALPERRRIVWLVPFDRIDRRKSTALDLTSFSAAAG
jgi:hypothetical protein